MRDENAYMELELLERDLRAHGRFVVRLLTAATDAFVAQDATTGELVLGLGRDVREGQARIDAAASRLLRSPLGDFESARRAVAARRVNDELDRIAELTASVAGLARPALAGQPVPRGVTELDALGAVVRDGLQAALGGVGRRSTALPEPLVGIDERLSDATRGAISAVAARSQTTATREWGLRAMMAVRCLRRVCDHSLRIAAQSGYAAKAADAEAVWRVS